MKRDILDLYSDYLLSSFGQTTDTGLAQLMDGAISHDQVTRMLSSPRMWSKEWWRLVKPQVRKIEQDNGVIIVDDSIVEKRYIPFAMRSVTCGLRRQRTCFRSKTDVFLRHRVFISKRSLYRHNWVRRASALGISQN